MRTLTLLLPALLLACEPEPTELEAHRDQWRASGSETYVLTVQQSCFCPETGPIEVVVEDGVITSAVRLGAPDQPDETLAEADYEVWFTIEGLFDEAERALDGADDVTIDWDPDLGYPAAIDVDWEAQAVDDEWSVSVVDLVLPGTE